MIMGFFQDFVMTSVQTKPDRNSADNYKYKKNRMAFSSRYTSAATEPQSTPKCQLQNHILYQFHLTIQCQVSQSLVD